jgi:hypothetical protein
VPENMSSPGRKAVGAVLLLVASTVAAPALALAEAGRVGALLGKPLVLGGGALGLLGARLAGHDTRDVEYLLGKVRQQ